MPGVEVITKVETALAAAHRSQETLNAFTYIDDEGGVSRAEKVQHRIDENQRDGRLTGVPIAVKDLIDQAGLVTTNGSAFYRSVPERTATCVTALEEGGGVVIGRTGLHEWAFGFSSENPHFGAVRNPWDPETSPGGSSGGSAASVAAGVVPIAIGTDTGGSVRVPAALCGIYGLKVTYGRIPLDGVFPLVPTIDTVGPLADSVDGIDAAYRSMSGDGSEPSSARSHRFGIPEPWYDRSPTHDEVAQAFQRLVRDLADLGHEVHPIEMPDVFPSPMLWNAIAGEVSEVHRRFRAGGESYGQDVRQRLDDAEAVPDADIALGARWQQMIRDRFSDAFATVDFLITPTVPVKRKKIGENTIDGHHYRTVLSYFTAVVNHSLHPAMSLPLLDSGSPPASLQVIGPRDSEVSLVDLAGQLDQAELTGFVAPPYDTR